MQERPCPQEQTLELEHQSFSISAVEQLFKDNALLAVIENDRGASNSLLLSHCVTLHNCGQIDFTSLTTKPEFEALSGWQFFSVQHFFVQAIPMLDALPGQMMELVNRLVVKGGNDLAANEPNRAFRVWCERNPSKRQELVESARAGDSRSIDHLTFALEAGRDLAEARSIARAYEDRRRISALTALARLPHGTANELKETVDTIAPFVSSSSSDEVRASVLRTAMDIFGVAKAELSPEAQDVCRRALDGCGSITLHNAAVVLWVDEAILSAAVVGMLLSALERVDLEHRGTVDALDQGLSVLVKRGFAEQAVTFVVKFFSRHEGKADLKDFDSFGYQLVSSSPAALSIAAVQFLLNGTRALCDGFEALLRRHSREDRPLHVNTSDFGLSDDELQFVCRKAIGYFFMQPVTAASVLISAIRGADPELKQIFQNLLFNPLLRSYGGKLREYLEGIDVSDAAYDDVRHALERANSYLAGLKAVGDIRELKPSEQHRRLQRAQFADDMITATKEAEKESVMLSLVSKSILLYGRRSVTFMTGPGEAEKRPIELELQSHSFTMEHPRLEVVDAVGLDEMLRTFRAERFIR
jgi:hypothetical protein